MTANGIEMLSSAHGIQPNDYMEKISQRLEIVRLAMVFNTRITGVNKSVSFENVCNGLQHP